MVKKSHIAKKPKKRPYRLIKRFLQTENFKQFKGVPFYRFQTFSEKCRIAPKKRKEGLFGLPSIFGCIKICGLVRDSNPRSPASQTPENLGKPLGQEVEQMNKKVDRSL